MLTLPWLGWAVMLKLWLSFRSTSPKLTLPLTTGPSSWALRSLAAVITGASLVPRMVTVTLWVVPSTLCTGKVSLRLSPWPRACTAGSLLLSW